jgi:transcriptional regulator with XRE-family HTH domain
VKKTFATMSLAQRLINARKQKGLTQEELADRARITVRTIQRLESGEANPRPYTLKAIAAALDTTFEALQATTPDRKNAEGTEITNTDDGPTENSLHFLQLFCLSCFSYLVVPVVHFIIPVYILGKRTGLAPSESAYARKVLRRQVYWVAALHLALFLTLIYNMLCAAYIGTSYTIHYLAPFFGMYLLNALIIARAWAGCKAVACPQHTPQTADNQPMSG